jgi:hypothetical protein
MTTYTEVSGYMLETPDYTEMSDADLRERAERVSTSVEDATDDQFY